MRKKSTFIIYIVVIISLSFYLWNSIHYFKYIGYSGEFAASLGHFSNKIRLIFTSVLFTSINFLIIWIIIKRIKLLYSIIIIICIGYCNFLILSKLNHSIIFPAKQTMEDRIEIAEKDLRLDRKEAAEYLAKVKKLLPDAKVVEEDKKIILEYVRCILSVDSVGLDKVKDSIHLKQINILFDTRFEQIEVKFLREVKSSIQLDVITYSPDFNRFLVTFSYESDISNYDELYKFDGIIYMGEKTKSQIELFNYSESMYQYGFYTRESVLYNVLRNFSYLRPNLIDEQHPKHPDFLSADFWNSPFYFSQVQLRTGEYCTRFKTRKYSEYQKPSYYAKEESMLIKK